MKRIFIVLVALMILLTSASLAEDLSALSDEELFTLCRDILDEMERRQSAPAGSGAQEDLPAFATINEALMAGEYASIDPDDEAVVLGMAYKGKYIRVISMLDEHAKELFRAAFREDDFSGWDAFDQYAYELPVTRIEEFTEMPKSQAELDTLVGKTYPEFLQEGYKPFAVWGEGESRDRHVITLASGLYSYSFEFDMTDEDYAKYVDEDIPGDWPAKSVLFHGFSDEALSLDYNPDGTPVTDADSFGEAAAETADTDTASGLPAFATINDAVYYPSDYGLTSGNADSIVHVMGVNGRFFRVVALLDDHGKELYNAGRGEDGSITYSHEFYEYAETLPVSYVEEFTVKPMEQAELDAMAGKKIRDLEQEYGYRLAVSGSDIPPAAVELYIGIYTYNFEVDGTYTGSRDNLDWVALENMTVKNGTLSGFSDYATSLNYSADGTCTDPWGAEEPAEESGLPAFATINDAMAASEGGSMLVGKPEDLVFVLEYGGKSYRVVSVLDDRAKALYKAGMSADGSFSISDEFYEYAQTLPVTRIEELTEQPMTRAEIDSLNGKTVRELLSEGYEYSIYYDDDEMCSRIGLLKGLYSYDFDTDEAFGKYRESRNLNDLMDVKVSNGAYSGFSGSAVDLSYPLGEIPEEEPAAEAPEISDSTVLYYLPSSLKNDYHLDPNCSLFNPDCLPLPCWFTYAELSDDMYRDLDPCLNCGAPERPVPFATLRDAMNAPAEQRSVSERSDRIIMLMEKDGESLRVITMLDARAKALYAAMQENEPSHQAFTSYAWGLPVTSVEKFTSKPLDQRELNSMSGKTIRELIGSRTDCFTPYEDVSDPPVVELSFGLFSYNFELDATREEYLKLWDSDAFWDLKVKNGTFSGFSYTALDTDGSEEP